MFQMQGQARQGDVFLLTVGELPANVEQVKAEGGRTILQHGEVTGHAHAIIAAPRVALYAETGSGSGGRRFLVVSGDEPAELKHEEHGTIAVPPGVHEIRIHREYVAPQIERQVAD